jgi:hypothetical protein
MTPWARSPAASPATICWAGSSPAFASENNKAAAMDAVLRAAHKDGLPAGAP